jgi:hypothetical protein
MDDVLGTCSVCGGAVTTPRHWGGVTPPIPTCRKCGATKKRPHGHVIEMEPKSERLRGYDAIKALQQAGYPIVTA